MGILDYDFDKFYDDNDIKIKEILQFLVLLVYMEQLQLSKTEELMNEKIKKFVGAENNEYSTVDIISINDSINRILKTVKRQQIMLDSKLQLVLSLLEKYPEGKGEESKVQSQ